MSKQFPHLSDSKFPDLGTVDVYKYNNNVDYTRWDSSQMRVTLCSVPWDLGEAHVGQRTIEGVGNVVYFADTETRDKYFDELPDDECYRFFTKYRKFHSDDIIKVPVPVTALADFNYIEICYYTEPNDEDPIEYENNKTPRWYYFIRDYERDASNTTRCNLMLDTWQTFIYDVDIPYMYLERGHYPVAQCDADTFLSDPINNQEWVQGEDMSFGNLTLTPHTESVVHNEGTMYALIATTTSITDSQGTIYTDSWVNPAANQSLVQNAPAPTVFAVAQSNLITLLNNLIDEAPQWIQGIQAVFMVSRDLISLSSSFTFHGVTCYNVSASAQSTTLIDLDKDMFGYAEEYEDLAKLYTYPYACIDIYTERGDVVTVNVEDTSGTLTLYRKLNYIYPFIHLAAHVVGVGSSSTTSLSFNNGYTFTGGGRWYELLQDWDIPCYQVTIDANTANRYETYWSREHAKLAATNAQLNANDSAATEQTNANASATTTQTNELASEATIQSNDNASSSTTLTNANASASNEQTNSNNSASTEQSNSNATSNTNRTNTNASAATSLSNTLASAETEFDNEDARITQLWRENEYQTDYNSDFENNSRFYQDEDTELQQNLKIRAWEDQSNYDYTVKNLNQQYNIQQATMSAVSGTIGSVASGFMNGGGVGAAVGLATAGVEAITGALSTYYMNTHLDSMYEATSKYNFDQMQDTVNTMGDRQDNKFTWDYMQVYWQNQLSDNIWEFQEDTLDGINEDTLETATSNANNTYDTDTANATRTYNTEISNASRTYSTDVTNAANTYSTDTANAQRTYDTDVANATRTYNTDTANTNRTYNTDVANASRTYNTAISNAQRDYDTEIDAIECQVKEARLRAPYQFGSAMSADHAATRPIASFATIRTQSKGAISQAGDMFLRYGYTCPRVVSFDTFTVMPKFTFWQCSDLWLKSSYVPDAYMDQIRMLLFGGVTVWKDPADIGYTSIYDNK